jgi:hypothetical protein
MNGQHNKKEGILFRHLLLYICPLNMNRYGDLISFL